MPKNSLGSHVDDHESLLKYAKLISPHDKLSNNIKELVRRIIEGEIRVLAASMTMEEVFRETKEFKQEVFVKVQLELNQFRLLIYNAMVDVAEAKMKGSVGSKSREGKTLQNAAKIDAETMVCSYSSCFMKMLFQVSFVKNVPSLNCGSLCLLLRCIILFKFC